MIRTLIFVIAILFSYTAQADVKETWCDLYLDKDRKTGNGCLTEKTDEYISVTKDGLNLTVLHYDDKYTMTYNDCLGCGSSSALGEIGAIINDKGITCFVHSEAALCLNSNDIN